MNEFERKNLEKLEQDQLINSILSRKQLETDALIQAAKENVNKSQKEIENKKEEILNSKLEQQEKENARQLEERKKMLDSVEKELIKWNEEERKAKEKRTELVNQILQDIDYNKNIKKTIKAPQTHKKLEKLEKIEREKFRKKFKDTTTKKNFLVEQLNLLKRKEKQIPQYDNKYNTLQKENTLIKSKENAITPLDKKTNIALEKEYKTDKPQKTISTFKMLKGIKIYQHNMDFYQNSTIKSTFDKVIGDIKEKTFKNKRNSFAKSLEFAINHKQANTKAKQQTPHFEPRTL